jgi:tRNA threonylcarbamoyladenosine biosynthesis protein TsaE
MIHLPEPSATDRVGAALGHALRAGDTVLLSGSLGAGKSALARAAIKARCGDATDVPSPTYTLAQVYEAPGLTIWHADLYRLGASDEVPELGLVEAFESAAVLVEWPDRLGAWRPLAALDLTLEHDARGDSRKLRAVSAAARWRGPIDAMEAAA